MPWDVFTIVRNRPLEVDPNTCPFCQDSLPPRKSLMSTLLGGPLGVNHVHEEFHCKCGHEFYRENRRGNVWYTRENILLRGIPSCFENYLYVCVCSGWVQREDMGGGKYGENYKPYPRFKFYCNMCNSMILSLHDHNPNPNETKETTAPQK